MFFPILKTVMQLYSSISINTIYSSYVLNTLGTSVGCFNHNSEDIPIDDVDEMEALAEVDDAETDKELA